MTVSPIEIKTMLHEKYFLNRCNRLWFIAVVRKYGVWNASTSYDYFFEFVASGLFTDEYD
ncbi:MAG: hypothetical protein DWH80_04840 [Planctomycetota bacterium]|nr:MAG: hypothetical protein DWH80_04840 [Planctomycetota bacterium]